MPSPPAAHPSTPLDLLWQAPTMVAVLVFGEGLALVLSLAPGLAMGTYDRLVHFGLVSMLVQWTALLTLGGLYLARSALRRRSAGVLAWIALGLLLAVSAATSVAALWISEGGAVFSTPGWKGFLGRSLGITLTVGTLGLLALHAAWVGKSWAVRAKQAELESLQARIRPHFLFNTLNTGAALVHARPGEAEQLLLDLADLFRAALSGPAELPLQGELELARRYLEIERLRFGDRLQVHWTLPDTLPDVVVPALSIQPLVENAIRHGIEPSPVGGRLDVTVVQEVEQVRVVVSNDLPPAGRKPAPGHQVGLASARERIEALSQGRGRLETRVLDGRYVATIILLVA
ncbi:MAG: sensor histidine kinase [Arenimonas sp.]|nr:sensor histidine kinase [Arenimonas sp.]